MPGRQQEEEDGREEEEERKGRMRKSEMFGVMMYILGGPDKKKRKKTVLQIHQRLRGHQEIRAGKKSKADQRREDLEPGRYEVRSTIHREVTYIVWRTDKTRHNAVLPRADLPRRKPRFTSATTPRDETE